MICSIYRLAVKFKNFEYVIEGAFMTKVDVKDLVPGDLIKKTQWIVGEGFISELRTVLTVTKLDPHTTQVEWFRIKKGTTCTGYHKPNDTMELVKRIVE